ncbi:neuropeptide y receptor type 6 [Lynx pardinus]|uniref:Neuropeptide y receptor type 6 n=1 Tax=Lynx pardinus TaxID=191816 RepID=A0A485MPA1_LYNPA|nr:neuropeptide y receptor type 6 [Lynx pardinus]
MINLIDFLLNEMTSKPKNIALGMRESDSQLNENKRINTILISTEVTFRACWLPLNIFNVIFDWYHEVLMSCHQDLVFAVCLPLDCYGFHMHKSSIFWISQQSFPEGSGSAYSPLLVLCTSGKI